MRSSCRTSTSSSSRSTPRNTGAWVEYMHLVAPAGGEAPEEAMQMALGRGRQIELRLLDQDHQVFGCAHRIEPRDRTDERQPAVVGRLVAHDPIGAFCRRSVRASERRRAQVRREEERVWGAFAIQVQGRGRPCVEEQGAVADNRFDVHARISTRDVLRPSASAPQPRAASRSRRGRSICRTTTRRRARSTAPGSSSTSRAPR